MAGICSVVQRVEVEGVLPQMRVVLQPMLEWWWLGWWGELCDRVCHMETRRGGGVMLRPSSDPPLFSSRDPPPDPMTTHDLEPSREPSRDLGGEASLSRDHDVIPDVTHDITGPAPDDVSEPDPDDIMKEPQLRMISSLRSLLTNPDYS